jgi:hypothetical protein
MVSTINEKGKLFYQRRKKDLSKYFYIAPVFVIIISFILVIGAKNELHLYFSFFLILFMISSFIIAILYFVNNLNKTISNIIIKRDGSIRLSTFDVLFYRSKVFIINKNDFKLIPRRFQINEIEKEEGWVIKFKNNKQLYLFKDFFDPDIIDIITKNS